MIYQYFPSTGACEAVQGLADLFTKSLQNDDVQDFAVRWDHALLTASETPNCQQLKTAVKVHNDQMMRNRNFRVRNDVVERGSVAKSQEGNKAYVERKVGECTMFQRRLV